jgi:hypothetical protein
MKSLFECLQYKRKKNKPERVNHLKNSILVAKGTKERGKDEAEGSRLKAWRRAKVFGEMIFTIPEGMGSICNRTRRRKRERRNKGIADCGDFGEFSRDVRSSEFKLMTE